jgi:hypothetical protein
MPEAFMKDGQQGKTEEKQPSLTKNSHESR